MKLRGTILKMEVKLSDPVQYILPIGDDKLPMNDLIGNYIVISNLPELSHTPEVRKIIFDFLDRGSDREKHKRKQVFISFLK